jgi:sigma-B regulation protein RsbU (phosphoserine phosphatase)
MQACLPSDEDARLDALRRYDVLDTPTEAQYDDITRLVAEICEAPVALITLIDRDRQFFKSSVGVNLRETPRDIALCAHALLQRDILIVGDTRDDPRFADNPLVTGEPHLRFYAGALLQTSDGFPLGTLCILDFRPRELTERQITALRVLARNVMTQLELRYALARERRIAEVLQRALLIKPPSESIRGMDVETIYTPAWDEAQVGGDFYDVFPVANHQVALVVGDVSGKGLVAAAHTAKAKFTLRVYLTEGLTPAQALTRLNDYVIETADYDSKGPVTFIALAVAVVDTVTGATLISVGGIEPPLIRRADGAVESIETHGFPVGIEPGVRYEDESVTLAPGDLLLLFTDGVTEARRGGELYGYDAVCNSVRASAGGAPLLEIGGNLLREAQAFAHGNLADDVCILLARRDGPVP